MSFGETESSMSLPPGKTQHLLPKSVFDRPGSDRWNLASTTFPDAEPKVRIQFPPAKSLLRTRLRSAAGPDPRACTSWPSDHIGGGRIEVAHVETLRSRDEVTRHEVADADVELHVKTEGGLAGSASRFPSLC